MYAIILDKDLTSFPGYWPVVARRGDIQSLRQMRQHSGNPELLPRQAFRTVRVEPKSLIDSQTGACDTGGIYDLVESSPG